MSRLAHLPVSLPKASIPEDIEATTVADQCHDILDNLTPDSFVEDAVWRDSYAFTGALRTFYGRHAVLRTWETCARRSNPHSFSPIQGAARRIALPQGSSWVEIGFTFEISSEPQLLCTALLSVVKNPQGKGWKIWVLKTVLDDIKAAPGIDAFTTHLSKPIHIENGSTPNGESHQHPMNGDCGSSDRSNFDCVIVGAGQAGLNTAARCAALDISYVVLEKNSLVGDNWRNRYDSARLHTIREYAHLPYDRTFKEEYPEFLSKDDLAKGYCEWVDKFNIQVWTETSLVSGTWCERDRKWRLTIRKGGSTQEITSSFVVLAVGAGGQIPYLPEVPGRDRFQGTVLHSGYYKNAKGYAGRKGVVVGSANTAHDIAEDMLNEGLSSTTMVQRSKTYVLPVEWYIQTQSRTYNANFPTALADKLGNSSPNAILRLVSQTTMHAFVRRDPGRFEALEKAGFRVDVFGDPTYHLLERLGGHYMDVGASAKIESGQIKMKSDAAITHYTETGLGFADGSELPADLIVFATGFELNLCNQVRELFGDEVADHFGEFSRMNDEGEATGAYTFCHPGLACHGGPIGASRWYSRFLVLHMKAVLMGKPLHILTDHAVVDAKLSNADSKLPNGHS